MAKEVKRQDNPNSRPPRTAANRVDFLRQIATIIGELMNDMQRHSAPNHAVRRFVVWVMENI